MRALGAVSTVLVALGLTPAARAQDGRVAAEPRPFRPRVAVEASAGRPQPEPNPRRGTRRGRRGPLPAWACAMRPGISPVLLERGRAHSCRSPAALGPDLQLRTLRTPRVGSLQMRASADAAPAATAAAAPAAYVAGARIDTGYRAVPGSWRDVEERVSFKLSLGYGVDRGEPSGKFAKNGVAPDDAVAGDGARYLGTRQYALGDAVLGSRGVLMPSLRTYFLSQFRFDTDGAATFATFHDVYDQNDGRTLLVHAAYAEVEGLGEAGPLAKLFVRAGRQFRYGAATFVANFDGVSAAYGDPGFELSGFVGRRVSLFFADDPGVLGGAGLTLRGRELVGVPVDVALDYLNVEADRQYMELTARYRHQASGLRIGLRGRAADNGDADEGGIGLARLGAELRYPIRKALYLTGQLERIFDREVGYDVFSPAAVDVVDVVDAGQRIGLALTPPEPSLRLGGAVMATIARDIEVYGFGRVKLVGETTSAFDTPWRELGVAVQGGLGARLRVNGQYKLRAHRLGDDTGAGSAFFDSASAGARRLHELAGEVRYSLGYRRATAAAAAYVRIYDLATPYAEVAGDARAGGRIDADYWLGSALRLKLAGELAQPSPGLAHELGTLASVRALMEVSF